MKVGDMRVVLTEPITSTHDDHGAPLAPTARGTVTPLEFKYPAPIRKSSGALYDARELLIANHINPEKRC
jgi:hypothetical protein